MKKTIILSLLLLCFGLINAQDCPTGNAGTSAPATRSVSNGQFYLEYETDALGTANFNALQGGALQTAITINGTSNGVTVTNLGITKGDLTNPNGNPFRIRTDNDIFGGGGSFTGTVTFNFSGASGFTDITCNYVAGILPVMYARFNAEKQAKTALLSWTTGSEINNDYFVIERSNDNKDYIAIGEIKGAGNSADFVDYRFTDENPTKGMNYYRLRQVDFDGTENMSAVKLVQIDNHGKSTLTVYPTFTNNNVTIDLTDYHEAELNAEILSVSGVSIRTLTLSGATKSTVNVADLTPGLYLMSVQSKSGVATAKFMVK